ncbi:hypothetical protein M0638_17295 [Roseomonas sp. NAR14]|uniref:Lipoprotein n=1 Tax=Roseomonas acroporae TaxID=2937791 RepID=A0A9X2BUZ4_9PROT|nr:hypothetical protein [Roseomonas acroporae]MCK8786133.1 hypothetical protein [Roseomonas acroporae]
MRMQMAGAALLLLGLAACQPTPGPGPARTIGDPVAPSANRPTGSIGGSASGGGVPVPTRPGGSGGVGSGNQPGQGGT